MVYNGWKLLDRVGIVSSNRQGDRWGYFVDPDNKDQITRAKYWAGMTARKDELTDENYYVTENKNFKLEIINSAGGSSQGEN